MLQVIVCVKLLLGQLYLVEELLWWIFEFVECDKVIGDDCFICWFYLCMIEYFDDILLKVMECVEMSIVIVKLMFVLCCLLLFVEDEYVYC